MGNASEKEAVEGRQCGTEEALEEEPGDAPDISRAFLAQHQAAIRAMPSEKSWESDLDKVNSKQLHRARIAAPMEVRTSSKSSAAATAILQWTKIRRSLRQNKVQAMGSDDTSDEVVVARAPSADSGEGHERWKRMPRLGSKDPPKLPEATAVEGAPPAGKEGAVSNTASAEQGTVLVAEAAEYHFDDHGGGEDSTCMVEAVVTEDLLTSTWEGRRAFDGTASSRSLRGAQVRLFLRVAT